MAQNEEGQKFKYLVTASLQIMGGNVYSIKSQSQQSFRLFLRFTVSLQHHVMRVLQLLNSD